MFKLKSPKKSKKYFIPIFAGLVVAGVTIPTSTSCSHVYSDQSIYNESTTFDLSKTQITTNETLDDTMTDEAIKNQFWEKTNLNRYKQMIVKSGVYKNTNLTEKDISIPYSSVLVTRGKNPSYINVSVKSYTRVFVYNGLQINLPNTAFPQHSSYSGTEYKINADTQSQWVALTSHSKDPAYLAKFISDKQKNSGLFEYIPGQGNLNVQDITVTSAEVNPTTKDFDIHFTLKCLYSQEGLNQKDFILHVANSTINSYSLMRPKVYDSVPGSLAYSYNTDDPLVNNSQHKIEERECMIQMVFNFNLRGV